MKRSAKVCWVSFIFSTIVIAAVAGLVIYFTAFRNDGATDVGPSAAGDGDNATNSTPTPTPAKKGDATTTAPPTSPATTVAIATTSVPSTTTATSTTTAAPPSTTTSLPTGNSLADHLSHSVPGFEYNAVDFDGDGYAIIPLDGSRSHTHYYEKGPPIIIGKLVQMTWFLNSTREKLADGSRANVKLPVGTTIVGLTVTDNFRDSNTDYATVVIQKPVASGAYCYYYPHSDAAEITLTKDLDDGQRPIFAQNTDTIAFENVNDFPASENAKRFQMRCDFMLPGGDYRITIEHHGPVRMFVAGNVVLDSTETAPQTSTASFQLASGDHDISLIYARSSASLAKLVISEGADQLQYDKSNVLPVLTRILPMSSTLVGGGDAKIVGIGLSNNIKVTFGTSTLDVKREKDSETEISVVVPGASAEGVVSVYATNNAGSSNSLQFQYSSAGLQPIVFTESRVKNNGGSLELPLLTGIKYGPDHRYYVSAVNNRVHSFAASKSMVASDVCTSAPLGQGRDILGLAFNPADTEFKLYVSASVLEWKKDEKITAPDGWANGQILLVKKNIDGNCLNVSGPPVIEGLPVSNHDHGVNGLEFDQDGKLRIQVGGFTNAGVNDASSKLGGLHENPLSGASLIADIDKPGFNGKITYDTADESLARQTGGDVEVYSPGWRNSFGITIHSSGFVYATDNGASRGFGDVSITCTTQKKLSGKSLADKLTKVLKGRYAGHPNRNRGRKDSRQCTFRGADEASDNHFIGPIATFESSTDGVIEYTANTFGGQLKGDLLCSKYSTQDSEGKVFRVQLNNDGDLKDGPDELWSASGLTIQMSPYGHLLMPRVYKREIMVLTPKTSSGIVPLFIAVMPFRGPKAGGNEVIVTGENFADGAVAVFGSKKCTDVKDLSSDRTSFKCKVPAGSAGQRVAISIEFSDSTLNVPAASGVDYWYMNV